jgi:RNA polymerase sigma-70 factor (ECF subfamily)
VCRRLLSDEEDALDATQEAMIAIARGIVSFDGRSSFPTWVYRVTMNVAFDELRRRRRRPPTDRLAESADGADRVDSLVVEPGSDEVGDAVSARLTVDDALARLSVEHRTAVVLRDMLDLEYAEIADMLGVPVGTVRSRIARGRAALAHELRPGNSGPPASVETHGPRT